ncbi:actin-related protein T2 [Pseudophryne corroboree]|uniref:actin-related protein T2 n=1 Tax=Pseudophryne corroboree TaxID=495146 RepID=UPI0030813BC9
MPATMYNGQSLDKPAVIFDSGSGLCKAGISGDTTPRSLIPSVVGRCRNSLTLIGAKKKPFYIGHEAQALRGILSFKHPMEHGIVTSWPDMEKIWKHVYNCELQIEPSERPVMLTEAPLNPISQRERTAEVMFETFRVPAMHIALQPTLPLYANGRMTGLVVECGDGVTHTFPIFEGFFMAHAGKRLDVAGRDITKYFTRLLLESGTSLVSSSEKEIAKEIKEELCYVALDLCEEMNKDPKYVLNNYSLPDGNVIVVGNQRFRAPEILFSPCNIGVEAPGLHKMIFNSIQKCDRDVRGALYSNIILSGGSTLFLGMEDRICKEMKALTPGGVQVNIIAPNQRLFSVWIGASVLTSLKSFRDMWVTSADYKEFGPLAVHRSYS